MKLQEQVKRENKLQKIYNLQIKLCDSTRIMESSLSNVVINLLKEFIKSNLNMDLIIKTVIFLELNTEITSVLLNFQTLKAIS